MTNRSCRSLAPLGMTESGNRESLGMTDRSNRDGVTLVELIVAMTILSIGLLAIVGTSSGIARGLGEARGDNLAATVAQSRFEFVAGSQCQGMTLGTLTTVTTRGVTEKYIVTDGGNNTLLVRDTVSWVTRRGTRKVAFQTLLPCRPNA